MDIFATREEKTLILQKIIQKLNISEHEKDLYYFSMEILDMNDFDIFFEKFMKDFHSSNSVNFISNH